MEKYQIHSVIGTFGERFNIDQCQEECAELIVALNHFRRGRCSKEDVLEEIADVRIMTELMLEIFDGDNGYKTFKEIERKKIIRLMAREDEEVRRLHDNKHKRSEQTKVLNDIDIISITASKGRGKFDKGQEDHKGRRVGDVRGLQEKKLKEMRVLGHRRQQGRDDHCSKVHVRI